MEEQTIETKKPSLFGMILQPGEQFERIRERPVIWLPLILLSILGTVVAVLIALNVDYSTIPGPAMSAEELELTKMFGIIFGGLGGLFGTSIGLLVFGAILFGIAKIVKSPVSFKQMFSLMIFTSFITTIGQLLNQLIIYAIGGDPYIMLTSINSFVGADGVLGAVLGVFEVFQIWYYVLLALGLVKVAQLSKPAAYTIAIIFFILGLIVAAIGGVFEGIAQF
ncbi:YIP1 family protein [Metabacillus litoralis]|uniref:Yip1 family protein n=1 Tax=Metabacillus TaxID=2675233 RepID=UPI001B9FD270|nr:Yip1 family protein [Metabacillus litoralis]MCM3408879.1 YIP1 family protein [Metabacillus litoralis]UHA59474.1 YIP1 family protein [Metabacillus litoralis]